MSTWEFRVVELESDRGDKYYQIFEVYYNDAGRVISMTEDPQEPFGENIGELVGTLGYMVQACSRPVLKMKEIRASWEKDGLPVYADGQPIEGEVDESLDEYLDETRCQRGVTIAEFMEKNNIGFPSSVDDLPPVPVLKWCIESETEEPS